MSATAAPRAGATAPPPPTSEAAQVAAAEREPEDARLMGHAYDGIREYDNPLPGWWSAIFLGSILFSLGYVAYYHLTGWGQAPAARYEAALTDYLARRQFSGGGGAVVAATEESLTRDAASDVVLEQGAKVFAARCAGCHTADGRGQIGPNLTDLFQVHGATRLDVFQTIASGVTGTAMIAWADQLSGPELNAVAAFAVSLRGKNLAGKAPEGKPIDAPRAEK